ncbi:hypothetical protein DZB84_00085 [Bacillus sp. HNG]|uniref:hypothetical protein n=1 Tax=Bacillus sp. HNG TaxID=2293325 RepID=UPI000E2FB7B0|nr:hypothetical protein [Bacillus sp. HNG]RFB18692.1 hypothetical protein DZB84_00085 [Bacillus sp. HNG]
MWWVIILILGILVLALFMDWRRKKNNYNSNTPNVQNSTTSNYKMEDTRYKHK